MAYSYPKDKRELINNELFTDASLRAYYPLEDINDARRSYTLTNTNTVGFSAGVFRNCADFGTANSNKVLSISDNLSIDGGACSFSLWIKMQTEISTGDGTFIYLASANNKVIFRVYYDYNGGTRQIQFTRDRVGVSTDGIVYSKTLGTTNWYHLGATYDGTTLKLYIDGELVAQGDYSGNGTNASTTNLTQLGAYKIVGGGNVSFSSSFIDDVAIFNRTLSIDEMGLLFSTGNYLKQYRRTRVTGAITG